MDSLEKPRKTRVQWDEDEQDQVAYQVVQAIICHPDWTGAKLLEHGQKDLLGDRRRILQGFSNVPQILERVQKKLKEMSEKAKKAIIVQGEIDKIITDKINLETRVEELSQKGPPLDPERVIYNAPTEKLLMILAKRMLGTLSEERSRIEGRLVNIERLLLMLNKPDEIPIAADVPKKEAYMPLFIVAGGSRQDFQKLQNSLRSQNIRFEHLDVSKPNQIFIGQHDRVFIWAKQLQANVLSVIMNGTKPDKRVVCKQILAKLQELIIDEADKVRVAYEAAKSQVNMTVIK